MDIVLNNFQGTVIRCYTQSVIHKILLKVVINQVRVIQRVCLSLLIETLERRQQITSVCACHIYYF